MPKIPPPWGKLGCDPWKKPPRIGTFFPLFHKTLHNVPYLFHLRVVFFCPDGGKKPTRVENCPSPEKRVDFPLIFSTFSTRKYPLFFPKKTPRKTRILPKWGRVISQGVPISPPKCARFLSPKEGFWRVDFFVLFT